MLTDLFHTAVDSAGPARALSAHWPDIDAPKVLALGKAAVPMARAAIARYGHRAQGICISPHGDAFEASGWRHIVAGHPLPDVESLHAGAAALKFVSELHGTEHLLVLISGGGSALMECPINAFAVHVAIQSALLDSGLPIDAINAVRVRLSAVKGGRLLAATRAQVTTLAISDVPGDALHWIASGPTVPWRHSESDVVAQQWLSQHWPDVKTHAPPQPDTPNEAIVIASPRLALDAAAARARTLGHTVSNLGAELSGDAIELGYAHAQLALQAHRRGERLVLMSGGETTVSPGPVRGRGGRNQTYLLALMAAIKETQGIAALAADTDGIDGTGPAAGAWFDERTFARASQLGLNAASALASWDAGGYFAALGQTVDTGPTGTNVNDFRAIAIGSSRD